jgi:CHRD domain-containing protein
MRNPRALAALLVFAAVLSLEGQSTRNFKARLSPVPVDIAMMANITGTGSATAVLAGDKLTINGTFEGMKSNVTIAQVHKGPVAGVRGPVVFDLTVSGTTSGTIKATLTLTPAQIADLEKRRLYIQIHSEKAPEGNLWGWLVEASNKK